MSLITDNILVLALSYKMPSSTQNLEESQERLTSQETKGFPVILITDAGIENFPRSVCQNMKLPMILTVFGNMICLSLEPFENELSQRISTPDFIVYCSRLSSNERNFFPSLE